MEGKIHDEEPNTATAAPQQRDFAIGLFDIGDTSSCIYSFLCPGLAIASARSQLDGSDFCFNFMCLNACTQRWLTRSAYGIGDLSSCGEDCAYSTFCSCCVANQLYQTTKAYGNPASLSAGPAYNQSNWNNTFTSGNESFINFITACCCTPCVMGQTMEKSIGMPFWLGCLFTNPFLGRNVMRYHYRIRPYTGSDFMEECFVPSAAVCFDILVKPIVPIVDLFFRAAIALSVMQLAKEAEIRGPAINRQYLSGYAPAHATPAGIQMNNTGVVAIVPAMVVPNPIYSSTGVVYASQPSGYGYGPVPSA